MGRLVGGRPYAEVLPKLVAWASLSTHKETYDDADHEAFEAECVYEDDEGDRFEMTDYSEWGRSRCFEELRPHTLEANGKGGLWRLELTLNDIGKSFLLIDEFASSGDAQLTI